MKPLLATTLALTVLASPTLTSAQPLSEAAEQRVARGEIVTQVEPSDEAFKTVTSVGRIRRSAHDVFLLMTDFPNYPRIYNGIKTVAIEEHTAGSVLARYRVGAPWPVSERTVTTLTTLDPAHTSFTWHRTDGSIRIYDGDVQLVPLDDHTCTLYYRARIDPGVRWLPAWFVTWGQSRVLPNIIQGLRDTLARHQGPYWAADVQHPDFSDTP